MAENENTLIKTQINEIKKVNRKKLYKNELLVKKKKKWKQ